MQPHNVLAIQITLPYKNTSLAQMHRTFLVQYMYVLFNKESNTFMFTLIWGKLYNMSHKVLVFPWDCTVLSNLFHHDITKLLEKLSRKWLGSFFLLFYFGHVLSHYNTCTCRNKMYVRAKWPIRLELRLYFRCSLMSGLHSSPRRMAGCLSGKPCLGQIII